MPAFYSPAAVAPHFGWYLYLALLMVNCFEDLFYCIINGSTITMINCYNAVVVHVAVFFALGNIIFD